MWLPINTQWVQQIPYRISRQNVILQDEPIDLDDLTEYNNNNLFQLEKLPNKSYDQDDRVQMDITIEMNLNY